jgi:hypothetical protein
MLFSNQKSKTDFKIFKSKSFRNKKFLELIIFIIFQCQVALKIESRLNNQKFYKIDQSLNLIIAQILERVVPS